MSTKRKQLCQLGSTTVTITKILKPNIVFFFSQVSIAVLPMLSSCRGDDGDEVVLSLLLYPRKLGLYAVLTSGRFFSLLPLRFGLQAIHTAPYFRQVCQSRSSQVWAAGESYCPILQAGTLHEVLLFISSVVIS